MRFDFVELYFANIEMEAVLKSFGKMCKSMGRAIDRWGVSMEGKCSAVEERMFSSNEVLIL